MPESAALALLLPELLRDAVAGHRKTRVSSTKFVEAGV
jgi:hypothetical protein